MKHWQVGVVMGIAWTVGAVCVQAQAKPPAEMVNAPELATPPGYSHAAVVSGGRIVFVAGQVGMNKAGEMVSKDDFRAQVEQAFRNLKAVLAAAGAKPENVVKLNYYVVGINHEKLLAMRAVRDSFVDAKHPPVSTLAGVESLFREDCQFEVEAVAVVP
jgi:enamine deaminase RidA (YjgF/YER057c/UK114 family)